MLLWQLYLGAAFIKLFGFSFTIVRMTTLLVAVVLAFFLLARDPSLQCITPPGSRARPAPSASYGTLLLRSRKLLGVSS